MGSKSGKNNHKKQMSFHIPQPVLCKSNQFLTVHNFPKIPDWKLFWCGRRDLNPGRQRGRLMS
jgi:hypothetical protein